MRGGTIRLTKHGKCDNTVGNITNTEKLLETMGIGKTLARRDLSGVEMAIAFSQTLVATLEQDLDDHDGVQDFPYLRREPAFSTQVCLVSRKLCRDPLRYLPETGLRTGGLANIR